MDIISILGYFLILIFVVRFGFIVIGRVLFPYLIAPTLGLTKDLKKLGGGDWAVVTGATDGIGLSYAKELAKKGFNLVLVSRTQEKLDTVAKDLGEKYPVNIKTVAFNFTEADAKAYEAKFGALSKDLEVGILVNNVGMSFSYPEVLHEIPGGLEATRDITVINCLSAALISQIFLPKMVERNKGIIVNISSASGMNPIPYLGVYSASKAFVDFLTSTLRLEYQNTGLTFQCILPMFVKTKMSGVKRASFFIPEADDFARSAIKTIGVIGRTPGCLSHAIQVAVTEFLPQALLEKHTLDMMKATKARALRIRQKQEQQCPNQE